MPQGEDSIARVFPGVVKLKNRFSIYLPGHHFNITTIYGEGEEGTVTKLTRINTQTKFIYNGNIFYDQIQQTKTLGKYSATMQSASTKH